MYLDIVIGNLYWWDGVVWFVFGLGGGGGVIDGDKGDIIISFSGIVYIIDNDVIIVVKIVMGVVGFDELVLIIVLVGSYINVNLIVDVDGWIIIVFNGVIDSIWLV